MARLNVKATVTAPMEITIPLVRADHAHTANIFRVGFEISLSVFSTLLGYVLSMKSPELIHLIFLVFAAAVTVACLCLSVRTGKTAKLT